MKRIAFTVWGEPKGKARPRFTRFGKPYTPKDTVDYEKQVQEKYLENRGKLRTPLTESLKLYITAYFEPAESYSKVKKQKCINNAILPTKKPDIDNILKIVMDALNKVAYEDDKQITYVTVKKRYSTTARIDIEIAEDKI